MSLNLSIDEVLTTTRSVRKRLDLATPVPRDVLLECLELAIQAPSGSNHQGWRWIFVEDVEKKQALADIYRANLNAYHHLLEPEYAQGDIRAERISNVWKFLQIHRQRCPDPGGRRMAEHVRCRLVLRRVKQWTEPYQPAGHPAHTPNNPSDGHRPRSRNHVRGSGFSADGYLLGTYRIATAPEPNSSRLTSFKSICFDSPANNVGPWPASLSYHLPRRLVGVKMGSGRLPTPTLPWAVEPVSQLGAGARPGRVTYCCFEHAGQNFGSLDRGPQAAHPMDWFGFVGGQAKWQHREHASRGGCRTGGDSRCRARAGDRAGRRLDVAKAAGKVCVRLPARLGAGLAGCGTCPRAPAPLPTR